MTEEWRPIAIYPHYEISNYGRVRSTARSVVRRNRWGGVNPHRVRERILRLGKRSGYLLASLHVGRRQVTVYIHQEVMRAFGPPIPFIGALVRHLDDDRANAHIGNLAWGTQSDNMADAKVNGKAIGGYRPKGYRIRSELNVVSW